MDITITDDQRDLRNSVREVLARECPKEFVRNMELDARGFTSDLWETLASLDWLSFSLECLSAPERGTVQTGRWNLFDLGLVLEEMGYALLPGPFFSTAVFGSSLILTAGSEAQRKTILPGVATGRTFLTVAFMEPGGEIAPGAVRTTAIKQGDSYRISGTKLFVHDAHIANHMICLARCGEETAGNGISLFLVEADARGIESTQLETTGGDKQYEVTFVDTFVPGTSVLGRDGEAWPVFESVFEQVVALKCVEMVGSMQALLDLTIEYARNRTAFGSSLASFQAVQHHLVDMYMQLETCRLLSYQALWRLARRLPASREVSQAKLRTNRAAGFVARMAHQIYGGAGYYVEEPIEMYTRRLIAGQASFGATSFHLKRLSRAIPHFGGWDSARTDGRDEIMQPAGDFCTPFVSGRKVGGQRDHR